MYINEIKINEIIRVETLFYFNTN